MIGTIFLVFVVCLDPHHCFEVNGGRFESMSECLRMSQPAAAKYAADHPAYSPPRNMTCGPEPADEGEEL